MATISATQPIRTITPPSSSHGAHGGRGTAWDYAVPLDNENSTYVDQKSYTNSNQPVKVSGNGMRPPLAQQTNGILAMQSLTPDAEAPPSLKPAFGSDGDHLAPARPSNLGRKKSDISHENSESDSLLDMYKSAPGSRSVPNGIEKTAKRKPSNGFRKSPEEDDSNWIHRDKLAQIESRELEEAGFPVGRVSRSASRSVGGGSLSRQEEIIIPHDDGVNSEPQPQPQPQPKEDLKRQRTVSPIPVEEEEYEEEAPISFELRTPEEVAAEHDARHYFQQPPARPNGSRIPIPKQSPVPVPSKIMERDSPLTRSRNGSGTNGIPELRPRSRSVGSQIILDDEPPRTPTNRTSIYSDHERSPKAKAPGKAAPTSGGRKSSTQRTVSSTTKPRNSSQGTRESPQKRPGTSSGLPRPSTSHRPEGEAPWIASMYKPDPRLPPDQQMLPTHAKRMAQEQWEKEGKTGTIYDREFRLLNTEEIAQPLFKQDSPPREEREKTTVLSSKWPLHDPPLGSPRSQASSNRPGTSGTEHGGYKMMPTIHSPPAPATPVTSPKPIQPPVRLQEPPADEKEKKGLCGCCVVM